MNVAPLVEYISRPHAVQVATRTADLWPRTTRGFGAEFDAEKNTLTVAVLDAQSSELIALLGETREMAVNVSDPISLKGVQVKGHVVGVEEPTARAAEAAARYWEHFLSAVAMVGIAAHAARGMFHAGAARFVTMSVLACFNQTPGPGAGGRL